MTSAHDPNRLEHRTEVAEADELDQVRTVDQGDDDALPDHLPADAAEGDALDQQRSVDLDDDDRR